MPNKDGTGPQGDGPKTGRCAGKCTTSNNEDIKDVKDITRRGKRQFNKNCGQGRGLKPCGLNNNPDISDKPEDK